MTRRTLGWTLAAMLVFIGGPAQARMSPREIYKTKGPGTVLIVASEEGSSSSSAGTGSIISAQGHVISNCHVIWNAAAKKPLPVIHVFLKPDKVTGDMNRDLSRHHSAELLSYDEALDLALLKIKSPPAGLTVIELGDSEELGPGDDTVAIGHPEQGGLWTLTTGRIGNNFEDFKGVPGKHVFQMETSLNRGNSGGPLFDVRGYLIGVNTAIARQAADGVAITGVNFAVKSAVVKKWAGEHGLSLGFGSEHLEGAVAAGSSSAASSGSSGGGSARPPAGGTSATAVDASVQQAAGSGPATTQVRRPARFRSTYRTPPRPYRRHRLLSAVDAVRNRAQDAFDDLDSEIMRRGGR
ncbi:MAG: trypsin-like peptidase domain-containing protein [Deltaproteobacteria bacterium]|nr:trypsin-like peptidase domain-containing protein [Deltaproteobacteria bacterium]